jgi:hydrogenase maturation protein HypF
MDDSVMDRDGAMLRRARGFVPDAITLPAGFSHIPAMLCTGAEMKNTFCLVRGNQAVLSQHFGDLSDEGVDAQWRSALSVMQQIYAFQPERVVCDAHPGYRARQWAEAQALPIETVLHHHAHAAACLAENGWPLDGGDVIALTLDGIGMGENGALWGGECLRVNYLDCEHLGGLPAVALPGAIWRQCSRGAIYSPTAWRLCRTGSATRKRERFRRKTGRCWRRRSRGINTPLASSCGRLFDAVACALGIVPKSSAMKVRLPAGWKRWQRSVRESNIRLRCQWRTLLSSGNSG